MSIGFHSDEELVNGCLSGEDMYFELLVQRYRKVVERLVFYKIHHSKDMEDILQETFLTAWLNMHQLKNADRLRPWLFQIARNKCHDYIHSKYQREEFFDDSRLESAVNKYGRNVTGHEEKIANTDQVSRILGTLKKEEKEILHLYYFENMTVSMVSQRLGIPEGTVKSRLYTARNRFRQSL